MVVGTAGVKRLLVGGHGLVDGSQCPAHDDGGRDHDAGRGLVHDGQVGAHGIDGYLQAGPQGFAHSPQQTCLVAGAGLQADDRVIEPAPACGHMANHAHGAHDAGVAQGRTGESGSHGIEAGGILQPGTGQALRKDAEDEDDDPAPDGHPAQGRMQHEDQGKVDGHPRQVEKGKNSIAAQKVAQLLYVAQVAPAACPARNCGGMLEVHAEHSGAEHVVEGDARTHQKAGAYPLQQGQHDKTDDGGKGDDGECGEIVAGQDLVIDLQHVDGESQLQDVDEHAEKKGISEKIPARAQKFLHVGAYPALVPPPWGRTPVGSVGTIDIWQKCPRATVCRAHYTHEALSCPEGKPTPKRPQEKTCGRNKIMATKKF